eukprot:jgi/Picre1/34166/NNA_001640.t1
MKLFAAICAMLMIASAAYAKGLGDKEFCYAKSVEYICDTINVLDACREACPGITDCELIVAVPRSKCKAFAWKPGPQFECDPACGK